MLGAEKFLGTKTGIYGTKKSARQMKIYECPITNRYLQKNSTEFKDHFAN